MYGKSKYIAGIHRQAAAGHYINKQEKEQDGQMLERVYAKAIKQQMILNGNNPTL